MTSLVERSRAALFDKVGPEERDPTHAALREVARAAPLRRGLVIAVGLPEALGERHPEARLLPVCGDRLTERLEGGIGPGETLERQPARVVGS